MHKSDISQVSVLYRRIIGITEHISLSRKAMKNVEPQKKQLLRFNV